MQSAGICEDECHDVIVQDMTRRELIHWSHQLMLTSFERNIWVAKSRFRK